MVIIGLTSWTGIARFTRAEFLRIKELEYVQAAKSLDTLILEQLLDTLCLTHLHLYLCLLPLV